MILKLLISISLAFILSACGSKSTFFSSNISEKELIQGYENEFDKKVKDTFAQIDSNKEKIKTVEEKEKSPTSTYLEKKDTNGGETFFRKNVLKRFANE